MPTIAFRLSRVSSRRHLGELIEPGAFWRDVENGSHQLRETTLEAVRATSFPTCVSRRVATFAWTTLEAGRRYLSTPGADDPEELWEVEIADGIPITRADVLWLAGSAEHDAAHWVAIAPRYWSGEAKGPGDSIWELIVGGPVRLLRRSTDS